jgi:CMP-N,N'-diacetyllegionaminic acid synthase
MAMLVGLEKMKSPVLIIVPARGGSKRLPGKNVRQLGGRSLLAHTAAAIAEAGLDAPVFLSTDDDAIAAEGKRLSWHVPFRRPADLATDDAATIDVVLHALDFRLAETGADPVLVMVLQPTSPLRGGACLRAALDLLTARDDADGVIGMVGLHVPPARLFFADHDGFAVAVSADFRRPVYAPNGAVYLARTAAVRAARSLYTPRLLPLVMDAFRSIDIDTEADWRFAEAALTAGLPLDVAPALAQTSLPGRVA